MLDKKQSHHAEYFKYKQSYCHQVDCAWCGQSQQAGRKCKYPEHFWPCDGHRLLPVQRTLQQDLSLGQELQPEECDDDEIYVYVSDISDGEESIKIFSYSNKKDNKECEYQN